MKKVDFNILPNIQNAVHDCVNYSSFIYHKLCLAKSRDQSPSVIQILSL